MWSIIPHIVTNLNKLFLLLRKSWLPETALAKRTDQAITFHCKKRYAIKKPSKLAFKEAR